MAELGDTDRLIVDALRADGRMSMRALADLIHVSRASAYARVARLERDGVITGYSARVDPVRYGYALSAYVYLDIAQRSWKSVRGQLLSMPESTMSHSSPESTTSCCGSAPATRCPCATWC
jgi:DNA-binding Lrp family transcriptional regulator